jgi:hypothetical protein
LPHWCSMRQRASTPPRATADFATRRSGGGAGSGVVRQSFRRYLGAASALLLCLAKSFPASAQVEPIRLTYHAPGGCPDEARFRDELHRHGPQSRGAGSAEAARAFDVDVSAARDESRGALRITGVDGSTSWREVTGRTCDQVVAALALMTALAIDPHAATDNGTGDPERAPDSPHARSGPAVPAAAGPDSVGPPSRQGPSSLRPTHPRWGVGLQGQTAAVLGNQWESGGGAFVDLAIGGENPFGGSFRASVSVAAANPSFGQGVGAEIVWLSAGVQTCASSRLFGVALALQLCAGVDAGVLRTRGAGLANDASDARPWVAPGALGRIQWSLPGGAWVEAGGGVSVPLVRYVFYYQRAGGLGDADSSRISSLAAALTLGVGYRFP